MLRTLRGVIPIIRCARPDELAQVVTLETAADAPFHALDPHVVFEPTTVDDLQPSCVAGRLLVAEHLGHLRGFIRIEVIDGRPHVEQVSVDPAHAGQRIGAALLSAAEKWAATRGFDSVTLTTYRDVPWNGPYYSRLGWTVLNPSQQGPELRALRQRERDQGLEALPRQTMIKRLRLPECG